MCRRTAGIPVLSPVPVSLPSSPGAGSGRVCGAPAAGSTQPPEAVCGAPVGDLEASVVEVSGSVTAAVGCAPHLPSFT
eukprot:3445155-Pyramimonas_sp.AAC.1